MSKGEAFINIDWEMLREQKKCLVDLTIGSSGFQTGHLNGLIEMIDSIQDQAVEYGINEQLVFGKER